jgi:hypothetical protein
MKKIATQFFSFTLLTVVAISCAARSSEELSVMQSIANREQLVARVPALNKSVEEAMPNVRYFSDDGSDFSISDAYVRGEIEFVTAGKSFIWAMDSDREVRSEVPFESNLAMVTTYHLGIRVQVGFTSEINGLSAERKVSKSELIQVGLALPGSGFLQELQNEWVGKKKIAMLLISQNPVFDYQSQVWSILNDGAYLGLIDSAANIDFPLIGLGNNSIRLTKLETSRELTVKIKKVDGIYIRSE